jgi:filamentous hemagglutinin
LVAPYLVEQAGGAANLTQGQRAAIVGTATLLGGLAAGFAGYNAQAGANAAQNEALNNSTLDHRSEFEREEDEIKKQFAKERAMLGGGRVVEGSDAEGNPIDVAVPPAPMLGGGDSGRIGIDDARAGHIFRDSEGHISDTPANRQLLENVANDPSAILGTDKYGTTWAAKLNPEGTQTWVGIRGGKVSYGGINQTPKSFNPQTGLASPTKPGESK